MGYIWQLAVIQLESSTVISGVALDGVPYHFEKNISPGGSADLLAVTCMLAMLEELDF